jgi:purine-binding chemotaxis protein CheW
MSALEGVMREGPHRRQKAAALVEVCSLCVADTLFGLPIRNILEIVGSVRPQPVPLAPGFVGGMVHYRGEVLTAVSLRMLLGMTASDRAPNLLVMETGNTRFGLLVDSVGEVIPVSGADYELNPSILDERHKFLLAGAYKLKDRLLVMLDPERLDPLRLSAEQAA